MCRGVVSFSELVQRVVLIFIFILWNSLSFIVSMLSVLLWYTLRWGQNSPSVVSLEMEQRLGMNMLENTFSTPIHSRVVSRAASSTGYTSSRGLGVAVQGKYFQSRRIRKEDSKLPKFERDPGENWLRIIPTSGFIIGLIVVGVLIYLQVATKSNHNYEGQRQKVIRQI